MVISDCCTARRAARLLIILFLPGFGISSALAAAEIKWNTAFGAWTTASNWQPAQVPGTGDTVAIDQQTDFAAIVDLNAGGSRSVDALRLSYGPDAGLAVLQVTIDPLFAGQLQMGRLPGSTGVINVTGNKDAPAVFRTGGGGPHEIGVAGMALLQAGAFGKFDLNNAHFGIEPGGVGRLERTTAGEGVAFFQANRFGIRGRGELHLANGATGVQTTGTMEAGLENGGHGEIELRDSGTQLSLLSLKMGLGGSGSLKVHQGAALVSQFLILGDSGSSIALLEGTGSIITSNTVDLGRNGGEGSLAIRDRATLVMAETNASIALPNIGIASQGPITGGTGYFDLRQAEVEGLHKIAVGSAGTGELRLGPAGRISYGEFPNQQMILGEGASLVYELAGSSANDYGFINAPDAAFSLDGTLRIELVDGFAPEPGDVFELFDHGDLTGTFNELDLPALTNGVNWRTGRLYSEGILEVVQTPGPPSTFAQWLEQHLEPEELDDPERTDPAGDPGGHGIPNLLRYAFDLDPRQPDRAGLPAVTVAVPEGEEEAYLEITYTRRIHAVDLDYHVQASDNLFEWQALDQADAIIVSGSGEDPETEIATLRDSIPVNQANQRFLRVKVDPPSQD